jgi:peptidoglycan/xylan/chitin deacetylase (PgdA/CDA1 family)
MAWKAVVKTAKMSTQRPVVSFTFDDFPRSAVLNGARILERLGTRGTFYAAGAYCGQAIDGITQYCAEDLLILSDAGHEIGCHTFHHSRVSTLPADVLLAEIELNKAFFMRHLPHPATHTFAYPFGEVSLRAAVKLQRLFDGCRTTEFGFNVGTVDLGRLRAIRLYNSTIDSKGIRQLIQEAVAAKAWLIFYTHDVDEAPSRFGCTPTLLEDSVVTALSSGAEVLPVSCVIRKYCGWAAN